MSAETTVIEQAAEARNEIIVSMLISKYSVAEVAEKLNMDIRTLRSILRKEDFKTLFKERANQAFEDARSMWKGAMEERIQESLKVLDYHIKKKNLKAVELVYRTLAIEKDVGQQTDSPTSIQVFLPTIEGKKETSVPSESIEIKTDTTTND